MNIWKNMSWLNKKKKMEKQDKGGETFYFFLNQLISTAKRSHLQDREWFLQDHKWHVHTKAPIKCINWYLLVQPSAYAVLRTFGHSVSFSSLIVNFTLGLQFIRFSRFLYVRLWDTVANLTLPIIFDCFHFLTNDRIDRMRIDPGYGLRIALCNITATFPSVDP